MCSAYATAPNTRPLPFLPRNISQHPVALTGPSWSADSTSDSACLWTLLTLLSTPLTPLNSTDLDQIVLLLDPLLQLPRDVRGDPEHQLHDDVHHVLPDMRKDMMHV